MSSGAKVVASLRGRAGVWRNFYAAERESGVPLPIATKLRMWRRGFLSKSVALYDLTNRKADDYVSDYAMFRAGSLNGVYGRLITGKLVFEAVMHRYLPVPKNLACIAHGRVIPTGQGDGIAGAQALVEYAEKHDGVVLKPVFGQKGGGVRALHVQGRRLVLDGCEITKSDLEAVLKDLDGYLVTEFVHQAQYARALFRESTNSIRILTMVDPDTQEPFIAITAQRIGSRSSVPVDNWSKGGLSALIDLDRGTLGPAAAHSAEGQVTWHERHPETGLPIAGVEVPHWGMIKESILHAVEVMPYLRYVGWDVVVTDDGFKVLEGNTMPGVNMLQVHGPLLKDSRVRRFLEHHGVIPRAGRSRPD